MKNNMIGKIIKLQRLNEFGYREANIYDLYRIIKLYNVDNRKVKNYEVVDLENGDIIILNEFEIKKYGKVLTK